MDITSLVDHTSVSVDNNIVMTSDICDIQLKVQPGDTVIDTASDSEIPYVRPVCGHEIVWQNPNVIITSPDGTLQPHREFGGVIVEVKETIIGFTRIYAIHAKSYVQWFDRNLIIGWFSQQDPSAMAKQMISQNCPGFTTFNVQSTSTQISPYYCDYYRPSEAVKEIIDEIGWGFYVDYWKDVHIYPLENFPSPLPNNTLNADTDTVNYGDLEIIENSEQQTNKFVIKGFKTRSAEEYFLPFTADGTTLQWSTGYRLSSVTGDVEVVVYPNMATYQSDSSFLSGGPATMADKVMKMARDIVDGSPTQGMATDTCYVHFTQHLIRIPNYNGAGAVPEGYVIVCRFHYMKDMTWLGQDPQAQTKTAALEGTTGVYMSVAQDASLTNSTISAIQTKGSMVIQKYRYPVLSGSFNSYFTGTNSVGWTAGQNFILNTSRFGGITSEVFFVQRVTKSIVKNDTNGLVVLYSIQFQDSPYLV